MIEHVLSGVQLGLEPIEGVDRTSGQPCWRLILFDGIRDENGNALNGTVWTVMLDDPAVAFLHEKSEGASKVVLPGQSKMTVVRGRRPAY